MLMQTQAALMENNALVTKISVFFFILSYISGMSCLLLETLSTLLARMGLWKKDQTCEGSGNSSRCR